MDDKLWFNAKKVVDYYCNPASVLPLHLSNNASTNNNNNTRRHRPHLVLTGPEFCHSLVTSVILPHYSHHQNITSDKHIDGLIDMCLRTIRSLGELSSNSNDMKGGGGGGVGNNKQYQSQGQGRSRYTKLVGATTQLGDLAEELLRLLLNTSLPQRQDGNGNGIGNKEVMQRRTTTLTHLYNNTLHTWSAIATAERDPMVAKDAALRAERLLLDLAMSRKGKRMDDQTAPPSTLLECIQPDVVSFNTTINAWCKSGRYAYVQHEKCDVTTVTAAERAEAILQLLLDLHDEDSNEILANRMSYEAVIQAWSRAMDPDAPKRAMRVLEDMLERYHTAYSQTDHNFSDSATRPPFPSHRTFSSALTTWARSSHEDAIEKAEDLFAHMRKLGDSGYDQCKPDTISYNSLLGVYSKKVDNLLKRRHNKAAALADAYKLCTRMDEIIAEMIDVSSKKGDSITSEETFPDYTTHKIALFPFLEIGTEIIGMKRNQKRPVDIYDCTSRAEVHLRRMVSLSERNMRSRKPSEMLQTRPFQELMTLYHVAGNPGKAMSIFDLFTKSPSTVVSREDCEEMIELLLNSGSGAKNRPSPKMIAEVEAIIDDPNSSIREPTTRMFNSLIEAHAKLASKKNFDHARKADAIMMKAVNRYNTVLDEMAGKDNTRGYAQRGLKLIHQDHMRRPNTFSLHKVLSAYAETCNNNDNLPEQARLEAVERMEEILKMMEEMHDRKSRPEPDPQVSNYTAKIAPNVNAYNIVLNVYATLARHATNNMQVEGILGKAESLLDRMEKLTETEHNTAARPDHYTYGSVLNILAQSKLHDAGDRAMKILDKAFANDVENIDIILFNTVLKAIASSKTSLLQAESMLKKLEDGSFSNQSKTIKPDKFTYSTVMAALANEGTPEAAKKVEDLYHRLVNRYESELMQDKQAARKMQPDIYCYNSIITAWSKIATAESCQHAERLLDRLLFDESSIAADRTSFSALIKGCSQRSDLGAAAADCERILLKKQEYQKHHPSIPLNFLDYNLTIKKYSDKMDAESCFRVLESLLQHMEVKDARIPPNLDQLTFSFNTVMNSFSRAHGKDAASKVQQVFELMNTNGKARPDSFTYSILMNAHAQSRSPDSFKAVNIPLERIIQDYTDKKGMLRPTIGIFNLLFKACEHSPACPDTNENPVTIAFERFSQIQYSNPWNIKPSHQTYSHMFAICKNHVQDEIKRDELVSRLFQKCCSDGQLSVLALDLCQSSMSSGRFDQVVGNILRKKEGIVENGLVTIDDFPTECKRNVAPKKHTNPRRYK